jgi:Na+-driven multidrug efflux pump
VDRILVGRGVGTDGMAAVTSAFPLTIVAMALGLLVGTGTGNRISVLQGSWDSTACTWSGRARTCRLQWWPVC